jgi:hypothetical protein
VDDAERMTLAVGRLSPEQRRLVGACLDAIVHGPYIPDDDEFDAVMGARARTRSGRRRPSGSSGGAPFGARE